MLNLDELQSIVPSMSIDYKGENEFFTNGTFDKIPANAFCARITTIFPAVGATGEFKFASDTFYLFVGESFFIDDVLAQANNPSDSSDNVLIANESVLKEIKEYKERGYQKVASTRMGVFPLSYSDAAFASHEEMAEIINKINQTFKSVVFSIQNSQDKFNKSSHVHR